MVVKNQFSKTLTFSFLFVLLIYVVTAFRTDSSAMVNPIVVGFFVILFISIAVGTHFYQKHLIRTQHAIPIERPNMLMNVESLCRARFRRVILKKGGRSF